MLELIGKRLGQYRIEAKIGEGGMAVVFKAYQVNLNRYVALKVLPPALTAQYPNSIKRFQREAEAIARLRHPNILPAYEFGVDQGYSYIVMPYVPGGQTLSQVMRQPISQERAIELISQIGDALAYAHKEGVIHRDLKPSNVLIEDGRLLLSDFGLARVDRAGAKLTEPGINLGTPTYMSPEQARGEKFDHRIDLYALGIILYEMLTGSLPHQAETSLAILHKRGVEPPLPPRKINPHLSEKIERVILRALAIKPEDRYATVTDFISALQQAAADKLSAEDEKTVLSIRPLSGRPNLPAVNLRTIWPVAGAAIIVVILGVGFWSNSDDNSSGPTSIEVRNSPLFVAELPEVTNTPTSSPTWTPTSTSIPPTYTPTSTLTPRPSPTPTVTHTVGPPPASPTVTPTPTPIPWTPTPSITPTPTSSTASLPIGTFTLVRPLSLDEPTYGLTDFEWTWSGEVPPNYGFEVSVWREDELQAGVHDAMLDNEQRRIESLGQNHYRLTVDITNAYGVRGRSGEYLWTVALVQIKPDYAALGQQAEPARLRFELPGSGGDNRKENGNGRPSGIY